MIVRDFTYGQDLRQWKELLSNFSKKAEREKADEWKFLAWMHDELKTNGKGSAMQNWEHGAQSYKFSILNRLAVLRIRSNSNVDEEIRGESRNEIWRSLHEENSK